MGMETGMEAGAVGGLSGPWRRKGPCVPDPGFFVGTANC